MSDKDAGAVKGANVKLYIEGKLVGTGLGFSVEGEVKPSDEVLDKARTGLGMPDVNRAELVDAARHVAIRERFETLPVRLEKVCGMAAVFSDARGEHTTFSLFAIRDVIMAQYAQRERDRRREAETAAPVPLTLEGIGERAKKLGLRGDEGYASRIVYFGPYSYLAWRKLKSGEVVRGSLCAPASFDMPVVGYLEGKPGYRFQWDHEAGVDRLFMPGEPDDERVDVVPLGDGQADLDFAKAFEDHLVKVASLPWTVPVAADLTPERLRRALDLLTENSTSGIRSSSIVVPKVTPIEPTPDDEHARLAAFFATSEHDRHVAETVTDWGQLDRLLPDAQIVGENGRSWAFDVMQVRGCVWYAITEIGQLSHWLATSEAPSWPLAVPMVWAKERYADAVHAQRLIDAAIPSLPRVPKRRV